MFPASYYPDSYFTEDYFPKIGATVVFQPWCPKTVTGEASRITEVETICEDGCSE